MPIDSIIPRGSIRSRIVWYSSAPDEPTKTLLTERGFQVEQCNGDQLRDSNYLSTVNAVVFTQEIDRLQRIGLQITEHASRLLDYDCRVIVQTFQRENVNGRKFIVEALNRIQVWTYGLTKNEAPEDATWSITGPGLPPFPYVHVYVDEVRWLEVANFLLRHLPGPAPNAALKPKFNNGEFIGNESHSILLKRAFWDCSKLHLLPMDTEGRSRANVYRAYASPLRGYEGQWLTPYFVKIGPRQDIVGEYFNYQHYVQPYIPFHLGPGLIRERCGLGARDGIIVGDFVAGSESLLSCAGTGRASTAIACLFEHTLLGWYRNAKPDPEFKFHEWLQRRCPQSVDAQRFKRAEHFGARRNIAQLRQLIDRCKLTPVLKGPIHGDLHASNVRVRGSDAIVIDFFAHKSWPLVFDPACLEASLLVEGFSEQKSGMKDNEWRDWISSIDSLYNHIPLETRPDFSPPWNSSNWFHDSVRQIRHYAERIELVKRQYAAALAVALLFKSAKEPTISEPEASRRAIAYMLAESILVRAFGSNEQEQ